LQHLTYWLTPDLAVLPGIFRYLFLRLHAFSEAARKAASTERLAQISISSRSSKATP
jgi:hypothetical protein